jgi:hypothetical protein
MDDSTKNIMNKFDKTFMKKTKLYLDPEQGEFIIQYGTHKIGEQIAYVCVTVTGWSQGRFYRGRQREPDFYGGCHELVFKHAPELKELIDLHLTSVDGVPMHYIENAKYWWECATHTSKWSGQEKRSTKECAEIFRKHVLRGALPGDELMPDPESMLGWEKSGIEEFLNKRREPLQAYTQQVLEKHLT